MQKQEEWSGILVYLENRNGHIMEVGKELLGAADRLAKQYEQPIYGAAIGGQLAGLKAELQGYSLQAVFFYETKEGFIADLYEEAMCDCVSALKPAIVLIGGTTEGRALAPRLAVAFRTGLTADCTELAMTAKGELIQIRPAFGGNIMARILTETRRPQMATVRPHVMERLEAGRIQPIRFVEQILKNKKSAIEILEAKEMKNEDELQQQKLLVAAGRGIKKKEDLDVLCELAEKLGGKLACSRALVEKGWLEPERQIGLSGQTVRPEFIITCGVSGSIQFLSGMRQSKNIIAINSDPDAPILKIAHYPICADLYETISELMKIL